MLRLEAPHFIEKSIDFTRLAEGKHPEHERGNDGDDQQDVFHGNLRFAVA